MISIKYVVVSAPDMYELIDRVNGYLDHDWKLQGGVSFTVIPAIYHKAESHVWMQAMVLEKEVS